MLYGKIVMKSWLLQFLPLVLAAVIAVVILFAQPAGAVGIFDGVNAAQGNGTPSTLFGDGGIITKVINILLFVAGALAVIMLIIGGLRYTISGGNAASVSAAKNTVLYAIVGLLVAFFAYAIVNWVIGAVAPGATGGTGGAGWTDV